MITLSQGLLTPDSTASAIPVIDDSDEEIVSPHTCPSSRFQCFLKPPLLISVRLFFCFFHSTLFLASSSPIWVYHYLIYSCFFMSLSYLARY